jgi:HTH-type transcriptional regulator/antitoxin HigA
MENTGAVFPPSKYIREEMTARNLTQTDLAIITGRNPKDISGYLAKERVTLEFAKELALVLGHTPEYWVNLETKYRLSLTSEPTAEAIKRNKIIQDYPLKDMQKRGWISKTDDFERIADEVEKFFAEGVDSRGIERTAFFKRNIKDENLNAAEKAWLHRARHLAKLLPKTKYNELRLPDLFEKLKIAIKSSESVTHIAGLLQRYGIRFIVIEPLPRAMIDGASFWLDDDTPVIALSVRFDNIGSFFFALIHELFHIKHRDGTSFDNFTEESNVDEIEQERREQAAEFLVPQKQLEKFIRSESPYFYHEAIIEFATKIGVHPGIIVGQLQKREEIGYHTHRISMVKVREPVVLTAFTDGWGRPVPVVKYEEIA